MIDLKKDADDDATPAAEPADEASAELTPPPSRAPVSLPERPGRRPDMPGEHGRRASQLGGEDCKKLIVGQDIILNGEISPLDRLVVEGKVDATLEDCREIKIGKTGTFTGKVASGRADIAGIFDGDLTAREHLVVRATGRITGNVRFGELEIERGGQIIGDLQLFVEGARANGKGAAAGRKKAPVAKAKRTPAKRTPAKRTPAK